jgi:cellulose synthase/poly-beta-1,6-N-acetylglucosamine synthase-like glycosyltransferase
MLAADLLGAGGAVYGTLVGPPVQSALHVASLALYNFMIVPIAFFSILFYLLAVSSLRREPGRPASAGIRDWPSVTVQIPTYNEPVAVRCAERCLEFDYPKGRMEVLIGDDSTDPEVSAILDRFARGRSNVRVVRRGTNRGFKAGNLNSMLRHSRGDIIVVFDSDFTPSRDFLKRVVPPFLEDRRIGCVQVKWNCQNMEQNRVSRLATASLMVYHRLLAPLNNRRGVSLLFGSGQAVRRDLLARMGGWQEGSLTEDVEFSLRALKEGYRTLYMPDFEVSGEVPFTLSGFAKQQKRWAYGNARAFRQHFRWILFGKRFTLAQKSALVFTLTGYVSAPILVIFTLMGLVSFFSGTPEPIDMYRFSFQTLQVILVSSGFLAAMLVALKGEHRIRMGLSVFAASLTIGFLVSLNVFEAIVRAATGRRMEWYMIRKAGNENLRPGSRGLP